MSSKLSGIQAQHEAREPDYVHMTDAESLHEDISTVANEVVNALRTLKRRVNTLHELTEDTRYEEVFNYTMYQLDTDTAQDELELFLGVDS